MMRCSGRRIPKNERLSSRGSGVTMTDFAKRFERNPILRPQDVKPTLDGLEVECLLNPGAFSFEGKTWLLLRVAERPRGKDGWVRTVMLDPSMASGVSILEWSLDDPDLKVGDPRVVIYKDQTYLTTLSHLR